jgi:hypothetical protein
MRKTPFQLSPLSSLFFSLLKKVRNKFRADVSDKGAVSRELFEAQRFTAVTLDKEILTSEMRGISWVEGAVGHT